MNATASRAKGTRSCKTAIWMGIIGVVFAGLSGPLAQGGVISPMTSMSMMGLGFLLALVGAVLGITGLLRSGFSAGDAPRVATLAVTAISTIVVAYLVNQATGMFSGGGAPIHDITTDTVNPPPFVAIIERRADAPNPPEYDAAMSAELQREAYPDIQTLRFSAAMLPVFEAAQDVAVQMGWDIAAVVPEEGRIEATAMTPWFAFKDDVVIRVRSDGPDTIVDVRSKSRVGRGDAGVNAARIRAFRDALQAKVGG